MNSIIKKFRKMPDPLKATLVFAIASFATSGINYITTPIFTRILTSAQYGTVAVYNSWFSILRVFASLTLIFPGILNVGLYEHKNNRWEYLSSILGLTTLITLGIALVFGLFFQEIEVLLALPGSLISLMLMMCLFQPATTFWTFKQRYEYRYQIVFFVSVGSAIIAQLISVIAVVWFSRYGYEHLDVVRLWSAGFINILVGIILYGLIVKRGRKVINPPLWKSTAFVAIPLIPHYLGSELLSSIDKVMISRMIGDDKAGIFALVAVLSSIGVLLWRALNVMFAPFVNEKLGERDFQAIRERVKPLLFMASIMCIIASLAAPEIIGILATDDYMEGVYAVPPIAAGVFAHALYDIYSAVSFFHKKSIYIAVATISAAICNIGLNYILITKFGYLAAGYTTLFANLLLVGMHYLIVCKIEKEQIYDGKFSVYVMLSVIGGCILCIPLYDYVIVRYVVILVFCAIMFFRRKSFIDALIAMKI